MNPANLRPLPAWNSRLPTPQDGRPHPHRTPTETLNDRSGAVLDTAWVCLRERRERTRQPRTTPAAAYTYGPSAAADGSPGRVTIARSIDCVGARCQRANLEHFPTGFHFGHLRPRPFIAASLGCSAGWLESLAWRHRAALPLHHGTLRFGCWS